MNNQFWDGNRVFLTGHTGFKGSGLALWLARMGARVTGFAPPPETEPNLYELAGVGRCVESVYGDVRDSVALKAAINVAQPDIVLHLAAQALVCESYNGDPVSNLRPT